jgi:transcriptional regulator with XRE-family HTH domain
MLTETISGGLEKYRIGPKLRSLRLKKSMGLAALADHTSLSPALLSKIERGQIFPTLPTLLRISLVFGVGLDFFFVSESNLPLLEVVRAKDRLRLPERQGETAPAYFFEALNFPVPKRSMDAYHAEFPAGAKASQPHHHAGSELIYVTRGALTLQFDDRQVQLDTGDAAHFDSTAPHSYCQNSPEGCAAIVIAVAG